MWTLPLFVACGGNPDTDAGDSGSDAGTLELADPYALWTEGTRLRGANVWQRLVYPELDGPEYLGPGPLGPPLNQDDFDALAALGANYVNLSHPGLFREDPPYELNEDVQANLDRLLTFAEEADLFVVITFRTGPGRSEFWAYWGEDTASDPENGWFDPEYYNNDVWENESAQDAWVAMWRYTAERYRDKHVVVGYDLMCEPNAEEVFFDVWRGPEDFYPAHAGTTYDWNTLYPRIVQSIREVDAKTPILIQPMGYGTAAYLPYMTVVDAERVVYTIHQYEPMVYTHQALPSAYRYPGRFDADYDDIVDSVDRDWLDRLLAPVDRFISAHDVPVACNEYGVMRWQPGASVFMEDLISILESRGINHALWEWASSWRPFRDNDDFNFRHGPNPRRHRDVRSSDLQRVIQENWSRNRVRPSNVVFR